MRLRALVPVLALLAGCASVPSTTSRHLTSADDALRDCAQWFRALDERAAGARARDVQDARVAGFPYLRVNRTLASFRDAAAEDSSRMNALVARMQALDLEARRAEIANATHATEAGGDIDTISQRDFERTRLCADRLRAADMADPPARATLVKHAHVPDAYSRTNRFLGFYVLARYPFSAGVRRHQQEVLAAYARDLTPSADTKLVLRVPPPAPAPDARVAGLLLSASLDPLGIPEVTDEALEQLFAAHAPVFEIEETGPHDRIGALRWERGAKAPAVDITNPVVYRRLAWTRYEGRTLLQLVYTAWFPERPAASGRDLLAGKLDGLTWRVTLAPDGAPLVYDTMHPCGCYHMFYPTPRAQALPPPDGGVEFMFSPQALPAIGPGDRIQLRIAARTHYLERVTVVNAAPAGEPYLFAPYDSLRSLPRPEGGRASVFGEDGLIAGSERPERFLFWPMGIASAGAMRQWGHHATAFVGRRHFDDADLLEKRFRLQVN